MKLRPLLVVVVALVSCKNGGVFDYSVPSGIHCGPNGDCPDGFQCVTSEGRCRVPCSASGACPADDQGNPTACDVDNFCRPICGGQGSQSGQCNGCQGGQTCDSRGFCREQCGGDLGSCGGFACVPVFVGNISCGSVCEPM